MKYQKLFDYMSKEHGVTLLETDMQEIEKCLSSEWMRVKDSLPSAVEIHSSACKYASSIEQYSKKTLIKSRRDFKQGAKFIINNL